MSCRHEIFHMINLDRQLDIPVCFLFLYSTINKNLTLPSSPYPSKQQTIVGWPWHDLEFKQTGATVGASFPPPAQHDLIWRHTIHGVPGYSRVEITALYTLPHYIHLEKNHYITAMITGFLHCKRGQFPRGNPGQPSLLQGHLLYRQY